MDYLGLGMWSVNQKGWVKRISTLNVNGKGIRVRPMVGTKDLDVSAEVSLVLNFLIFLKFKKNFLNLKECIEK